MSRVPGSSLPEEAFTCDGVVIFQSPFKTCGYALNRQHENDDHARLSYVPWLLFFLEFAFAFAQTFFVIAIAVVLGLRKLFSQLFAPLGDPFDL